MAGNVFVIVVASALLHAAWNAIVKGAPSPRITTAFVTAAAAALALAALPFLPSPAAGARPFIAASAVIHVLYFGLLARTYRLAPMSQAYPLMRGIAPLLVLTFVVGALGERLPITAIAGSCLLCAGLLAMSLGPARADARGLRSALAVGLVIAVYTVVDGIGVRRAGAAAAYTAWVFLLTGIPLAAWTLTRHALPARRELARALAWGIGGGLATLASYGMALWAMRTAPVAAVAALRETSILFGVLLSAAFLGERVGAVRMAAGAVIALGAVLLRL